MWFEKHRQRHPLLSCWFQTALPSHNRCHSPACVSNWQKHPSALKASAEKQAEAVLQTEQWQWTQEHADSARVTLSPFISDSSCQTDTLIHFSLPQTSEPNRKWNGIRLSTGSLFLYNRYQSTYTHIVHINTFEVVRRVMCYSKKSMKSAQFRFALQAQIET